MGKEHFTKADEISRNYSHFRNVLPELVAEHEGKYALLRDGQVVQFFDSALDAQITGNNRFADELFSIQLVKESAEELGFFAYALHSRQA